MNFNPRSHEGSDRRRLRSLLRPVEFQSTLPRGERRNFCRSVCQKGDFNPRSHEGSDTILLLYQAGHRISIHAPTRGATIKRAISMPNLKFQSTLPRGERHSVCINFFCALKISIHAPTRGATRCSYKLTNMSLISIHAPTRGATVAVTLQIR